MPDGVFGATVITPLASTLSGPVVIGVTFVLVVVTKTPFKVSFPITVPGTVVTPEPELTVTAGSITASITLFTITVAVVLSQFAGETFNPVTLSASQI